METNDDLIKQSTRREL